MLKRIAFVTIGFSVIIALQLNLIVGAQENEKSNPVLEKAIGQYKHENYEEALALLKKVRQEQPRSTIAAYYTGLTYKKMQDYKSAIPNLRDAVTYSPKIKGALVELIDCLGQAGDFEEAYKWIAEAEAQDIRPAQVAFLKGLILMKSDKPAEAIESFRKAERIDPSMSQACSYQIGMANIRLKKFSEAREVFKQVIITDPNSTMA
ncbi:MAG: tetratricopeptide repeat protein, partial [Candidatus Omnitrophica bacterium]|nr:tetratricopeptide repeat protein [Candidatus Omnitrophota bacterium]